MSYALAMIHSGISQRTRFDPSSAKRSFTIGITDIGEIYFLPTESQFFRGEACTFDHQARPEVSRPVGVRTSSSKRAPKQCCPTFDSSVSKADR